MDVAVHAALDLEAMGCGSLVIALLKAMRPLREGQVLEARALDPGAEEDIPAWCRLRGHGLLAGPCGAENALYYIEKGKE